MAYQKKTKQASEASANEVSISDINKCLSSTSSWGSLMSEGTTSQINSYIHSGNYILNAAFSGSILKGVPANRTIVLSGESSTGKTYLLLNMCREAQRAGYYVIYYDSENAVDPEIARSFGIDLSKMRYEPVATVQDFRTSITSLTEYLIEQKKKGYTIPKILFALDSAGNLASSKEVEDAASGSDKADMTRSKILKSLFRILMVRLGYINSTFICTNHIYKTLDLFAKNVQSGGCVALGTQVLRKTEGPDEAVAIEDLKEDDQIVIPGSTNTVNVKRVIITHRPAYRITLEGKNESITVSDNHAFAKYNANGTINTKDPDCWVTPVDIQVGDQLLMYQAETEG